jgi:ankyrin repeat protein
MKALKIFGPLLLIAVIFFYFWHRADTRKEFRDALYSGNHDRVEALLKAHPALANARHMDYSRGERPNPVALADNWTPLHVAAYLGDADLIRLLMKYHADPNATDQRGLTPLLWTAFGGKHAAAAALLQNGANVNARGPDGRTTLDLAKLSLDTELLDLLRQYGAKE